MKSNVKSCLLVRIAFTVSWLKRKKLKRKRENLISITRKRLMKSSCSPQWKTYCSAKKSQSIPTTIRQIQFAEMIKLPFIRPMSFCSKAFLCFISPKYAISSIWNCLWIPIVILDWRVVCHATSKNEAEISIKCWINIWCTWSQRSKNFAHQQRNMQMWVQNCFFFLRVMTTWSFIFPYISTLCWLFIFCLF